MSRSAVDGPFGIPFGLGELPRTTCETEEELLKRRPELRGRLNPFDDNFMQPDWSQTE